MSMNMTTNYRYNIGVFFRRFSIWKLQKELNEVQNVNHTNINTLIYYIS